MSIIKTVSLIKTNSSKLVLLVLAFCFFACSTVKVVNSWSSDNIETLESKKILVIVKAKKEKSRKTLEDKIAQKLRGAKFDAVESYTQFSQLNPNDTLTEADIDKIKQQFKEKGFNAVVYSAVIGVERLSKTTVSGGYEAGTTLGAPAYINTIGFYGFYTSPIPTPAFKGVYEEPTYDVQTAKVYVLETRTYDLDLPEKEQLVAIVTSKIENVETSHNLVNNYAKAVLENLTKK
ncbi:hypothetical protein [Algibacter mikhailovii]|uniref:DUF4136 domain-containing protein n=1 Tax=Algibacter mikhailovii TaxID=425498 RepID=A0A918RBY9_9FLAO|nr:hypothetical protein [Algibacter mikhailovii]GGZ92762.1 hypothetical protein GCM10007028_33990 [Algibacter mikhailovii]